MSSEGKKAKGKQKLKDGGKKMKKKGAKEDDGAELTDREESDEDDSDGMSHSKLNPTPHHLVEFAKTHMSRNCFVDLLYNGQFKAFQDTNEFKTDTSRAFEIDTIGKIQPKETMNERLKYCLVYHYIYHRTSPGYFKFEKFCSDAKQDDLLWFVGIFDSLHKYENDCGIVHQPLARGLECDHHQPKKSGRKNPRQ